MEKQRNTKVLIADGQFLTRNSLASLIAFLPRFQVVDAVDSHESSVFSLRQVSVDLIVYDQSLAEYLPAALQDIRQCSQAAILLLADEPETVLSQMPVMDEIGGMLTKSCSYDEVIEAVQAVARRQSFFCSKISVPELFRPTSNHLLDRLSAREREVLRWVAKGMTTAQIADAMHLSAHTVNSHRKNLLKKLEVKSPAALIALAAEKGWTIW